MPDYASAVRHAALTAARLHREGAAGSRFVQLMAGAVAILVAAGWAAHASGRRRTGALLWIVAAVGGGSFTVSLIPTTLQRTTLGAKASGAAVNLEVDVMAKYAERLLGFASVEAPS